RVRSTAQPEAPAPPEPVPPDVTKRPDDGSKASTLGIPYRPPYEWNRHLEKVASLHHRLRHHFRSQKRAVSLQGEGVQQCRRVEVDILKVVEIHSVQHSEKIIVDQRDHGFPEIV